MNKKQLSALSENLFSDIEKKSVEIKSLQLKLADKAAENTDLKKENTLLEATVKELSERLEVANKRIIELENMPPSKEIIYIEKPDKESSLDTKPPVESKTNNDIKDVLRDIETANAVSEITVLPLEITDEQRKILRNEGALAIARLTKLTAYVSGRAQDKEDSEQLYSMALGKNETFKIRVAKIVETKEDFEATLDNLRLLEASFEKEIKNLINE